MALPRNEFPQFGTELHDAARQRVEAGLHPDVVAHREQMPTPGLDMPEGEQMAPEEPIEEEEPGAAEPGDALGALAMAALNARGPQ